MEPISIGLDPDVKEALQEFAAADDRTLSALINRTLRQYVQAYKKPKGKG